MRPSGPSPPAMLDRTPLGVEREVAGEADAKAWCANEGSDATKIEKTARGDQLSPRHLPISKEVHVASVDGGAATPASRDVRPQRPDRRSDIGPAQRPGLTSGANCLDQRTTEPPPVVCSRPCAQVWQPAP